MKRYLVFALFVFFFTNVGYAQYVPSPDTLGINVLDPIVPYGGQDVYPTHYANYGKGGMHVVDSISHRDQLPAARRLDGMLVFVKSDTGNASRMYQLRGGTDNTNWQIFVTDSTGAVPQLPSGAASTTIHRNPAGNTWVADSALYNNGTEVGLKGGRFRINPSSDQTDSVNLLYNLDGKLYWKSTRLDTLGGGGSTTFDGDRTVTRTGVAQVNVVSEGATVADIKDFLNAYFFPTTNPDCGITGTVLSTYENRVASDVQVNLTEYHVNKTATSANIATATITCNASPSGFTPGSFFSSPTTNTGSVTGIFLEINTTNTFTVSGTTTDGKSCSASKSYTFGNYRRWGKVAAGATIDNPTVLGLAGQDFTTAVTSGQTTYTFTSLSNERFCIAFPTMGATTIYAKMGMTPGLATDFCNKTTMSFTNASGYATSYDVYVSINTYNDASKSIILSTVPIP